MKRGIIALVLVAVFIGAFAVITRHASAFSLFGWDIDFWPPQSATSPAPNNGKQNTQSQTFSSSSSYSYNSSKPGQSKPCQKYSAEAYTVCSQYYGTSILADLVPCYTFANSGDQFMKSFALGQLNSGFSGTAKQEVANRINSWPAGEMNVAAPKITINSINLSPDGNTATLTTTENWTIKTDSGQTVYSEKSQRHTVTMQQKSNSMFPQWLVTDIR